MRPILTRQRIAGSAVLLLAGGAVAAVVLNDEARAGIEAADSKSGVRVIRATSDDHALMALAGGVLRYLPEGRCFVLDRAVAAIPDLKRPTPSASFSLVVWPTGTQPTESDGLPAVRIGRDVVRSGDPVALGGGYGDGSGVAKLLAELVPAACSYEGVFFADSLARE